MKYFTCSRSLLLSVLFTASTLVGTSGTAFADEEDTVIVRFATFNASLNRDFAGDLAAELAAPGSMQPDVVAEIIQRTRPDVLLINEFDFDVNGDAAQFFLDNYLSVPHGDALPIIYPYWYVADSNTGVFSGFDLDNSGVVGDFLPGDSFGFGLFPGQFAFVIYSMYPIDHASIRTFQNFLWADMPGALLPFDPVANEPWYSDDELDVVRLSSKNHVDLPIEIGEKVVHFLVSHPTPPVFDGPEDRNGTRNYDEIRFWADYIGPGRNPGRYIYDYSCNEGGLKPGSLFVIAGDQNADPFDGDSIPGAAQLLLDHPLVNTKVTPWAQGGIDRGAVQGGSNDFHLSDPAEDTADFSEAPFGPGNLRADYVLPGKSLQISDAGIFWPADDDPLSVLTGTGIFGDPNAVPGSDHRLVWVDIEVPYQD